MVGALGVGCRGIWLRGQFDGRRVSKVEKIVLCVYIVCHILNEIFLVGWYKVVVHLMMVNCT
jgi:hypothetical protein